MNEIQNQYKSETGQKATACIPTGINGLNQIYVRGRISPFLDADGDLILFHFSYVKWLEEKVESLQKKKA